MASKKLYDFICIGAGSGAMGAGRKAAALGKKVAMIENKVIGGTCVNVGCVPKKVMFNLSSWLEEAHLFKDYGVQGTEHLKLDFPTFKAGRDAYVKRLNGIYMNNITKQNIDYYTGTASFLNKNAIETSEGVQLEAEHIMIASGSYPSNKQLKYGDDLVMTSDGFFAMEKLPESMIVLGGGYIGVEMAQIMNTFGVKTTLLVRDKMLRLVDQELVPHLIGTMKNFGLDVRLKAPFVGVKKLSNGMLQVDLADGTAIQAQTVLAALGRPCNTEPLKLQNAGVETLKGAVKVDEYQNTNVDGIYAIGDVTNQINLTPVAIRQGRIVSERIFNGNTNLKMSYDNVASAIFSHPTIAVCGLTEEQAVQKYGLGNVKVYTTTFKNMYYALAKKEELKTPTMFKLVCHIEKEGVERIKGCHLLGKGVDEMMQTISTCMIMGATKQDFDNTVAIHPIAAEELVTMDSKIIM